MKLKRKGLVIASLALVLLLTGAGWYALQCLVQMRAWPDPGPAVAHAEATKYTCGMHPMIVTDAPGSCPICGMDLVPLKTGTGGGTPAATGAERKIKYWVAPMDPTYIRDEPGKSPMGMDLVPVYEDQAPGGSTIVIDPVVAQNMGVRTAPVRRADLARTVRTVGLIAYPESQQFVLTTKINGWVEKLYVNETGQQVRKGQRLLAIYSPELVSAQEEYLLALKNSDTLAQSPFPQVVESGRQLLEASRRRLQLWDISERQIERLQQTRQVEKQLVLYAPQNGIVTMKMVQEGQFVKSGMNLMTLSDIATVWVLADIYEYELPWIKTGQSADIILPFVGSKQVSARLDYLYPYVEPKTRTVKARFELNNPDFELKPDMYVNVHLHTSPVKDALTVPAEAVLHSGDKETVFVALGGGKFEPRRVKTGVQDDQGNLQIAQGLLDGETVVTSAQFLFDSESKLREAIAKLLEPKNDPTPAGQGGGTLPMDDLFDTAPANGKEKSADQAQDLFK